MSRDSADALAELLRVMSGHAARDVTGALAERIEESQRTLIALWIAEFGSVDADPTLIEAGAFSESAVGTIRDALDPAVLDPGPLTRTIQTAYELGVKHGMSTSPSPVEIPDPPGPAPGFDLETAVREQSLRAQFDVSRPSVAAHGYGAVMHAGISARQAVTRIESTVAHTVTEAATTGTVDVARATGASLVWVAERDGCLHCLAYSGQTTASTFSPVLSFDEHPLTPVNVLPGPPLHPHCRCLVELWDPRDTGLVEGLQREARRSVLQGKAQASEPAKLRAAARLLELGSGLPKTVEAKARRAVRDGRF